MKHLSVTWKGTAPLLMHSPKTVNPLHPIAIELKKLTSVKKKTEENYRAISDLEWEAGAYWDDEIGLYIPGECIEATLIAGAKHFRNGKEIVNHCHVVEMSIPLNYYENLTKEQLISDYRFRDTRTVVIKKNRINRTRPRFDRWEITFTLRYDEEKIDLETIVQAMEYAGPYVGLCDYRPRYGTFSATIEEID